LFDIVVAGVLLSPVVIPSIGDAATVDIKELKPSTDTASNSNDIVLERLDPTLSEFINRIIMG
jgi:hypothetical protein